MFRIWVTLALVLFGLGVCAWGTDFVTLQGETTIYTVACDGAAWQDKHCSGKLVAGDRFRFRALRAHEEVLFWTIGASGPSHKFSNCKVVDGRNWRCPTHADEGRTVTREIKRGVPIADKGASTKPYYAVAKWRWLALRAGLPGGSDAD